MYKRNQNLNNYLKLTNLSLDDGDKLPDCDDDLPALLLLPAAITSKTNTPLLSIVVFGVVTTSSLPRYDSTPRSISS